MANHDDAAAPAEFLPGFEPLEILWLGESPICSSKHSAYWLLKRRRQELIDANALALHRNRMFVHRERLCRVLEEVAVAEVRRRFAAVSVGL